MNRFRNYVLIAAGFGVLVMVVGVFSAGPAIAQAVRAALVSNVDDPGRIPYRVVHNISGDCSDFCLPDQEDIQAVPIGKRLVITNVSGSFRTTAPGGTEIAFSVSGESGFSQIPMIFAGSFNGHNAFAFNQQVLLFFDPGPYPPRSGLLVSADPGYRSGGSVTLSGYLLDCTTAPCAAIQGGFKP